MSSHVCSAQAGGARGEHSPGVLGEPCHPQKAELCWPDLGRTLSPACGSPAPGGEGGDVRPWGSPVGIPLGPLPALRSASGPALWMRARGSERGENAHRVTGLSTQAGSSYSYHLNHTDLLTIF